MCSSTIVSRILTYGAYPCTGAHCEVVGRCCVVWVDVGRCSVEVRVAEAIEVVVYAWFVVVVMSDDFLIVAIVAGEDFLIVVC